MHTMEMSKWWRLGDPTLVPLVMHVYNEVSICLQFAHTY